MVISLQFVHIDRRELTQDVLQYILVSCGQKGFAREADIRKFFLNIAQLVRTEILENVCKCFEDVFGYSVIFRLILI